MNSDPVPKKPSTPKAPPGVSLPSRHDLPIAEKFCELPSASNLHTARRAGSCAGPKPRPRASRIEHVGITGYFSHRDLSGMREVADRRSRAGALEPKRYGRTLTSVAASPGEAQNTPKIPIMIASHAVRSILAFRPTVATPSPMPSAPRLDSPTPCCSLSPCSQSYGTHRFLSRHH